MLSLVFACASASGAPSFTERLARHDLDVHDFQSTGRGLRTLRSRARGEVLLAVPDADVVLAERVLEGDDGLRAAAEHAAQSGRHLTEDSLLACFIANARTNHPASSMLPAVQPSVVSMEAEAALLPRCYASAAEESRAHAISQHATCTEALRAVGAGEPPLDAFLRAWAHVRARSVQFREGQDFGLAPRSELLSAERGLRKALLPYFDMINHQSGAGTKLVREGGAWQLVAEGGYGAGEQVFVSYGAL